MGPGRFFALKEILIDQDFGVMDDQVKFLETGEDRPEGDFNADAFKGNQVFVFQGKAFDVPDIDAQGIER